ncbi:MAG TPA: cytochrome c3 family protein [Chthoniobacteraceae bacterium]
MAGPNRTQKQVAEKYKGNLDYFRKGHYLRRLRLLAFLLAVFGSIAAVLTFRDWGTQEAFNTGPLSANHARFVHDCKVCHEAAQTDPLNGMPFSKIGETFSQVRQLSSDELKTVSLTSLDKVKSTATGLTEHAAGLNSDRLRELAEKGLALTDLTRMDQACLKCHDPVQLHAPQAASLGLLTVSKELSLVHAGSCSSCHREHEGPGPMKLPASDTCASCHNSADRLERTLKLIKLDNPQVPQQAENRDLGDGLLRFIVPPKPTGQPVVFDHYANGHPPFDYERPEARDPGTLNYNHQRHEQDDIPMLNGRKMDCADCHKPGADGVYYQRVSYEQNCKQCHSLHLDPDIPSVAIPHGDPEKVRAFLRSLTTQYADHYVKENGTADRFQLGVFIKRQFEKLNQRGMRTGEELERRVFFTGDPPRETERITPRTNKGLFFPACAKCHEVTAGESNSAPRISPVNIADRWVHRGPFTHVPHKHMACNDCHGAAHESTETSDILMPSQKLCAECHRPLQVDAVVPLAGGVALRPGSTELAAKQRREGGVMEDCQSCHTFHAPPEAIQFARERGIEVGSGAAKSTPLPPSPSQ